MKKRCIRGGIIVVLAASITWFPAGRAHAACIETQCPAPNPTGTSEANGPGYLLTLSGQQKVDAVLTSAGVSTGPQWYYDFAPACSSNVGTSTGTPGNCAGAGTDCPNSADTRYLVFAGPNPANLPQVSGVTVCLGPQDLIPGADIPGLIGTQIDQYVHVPSPLLHLAPPDQSIVNLPTVFWATPQPPISVTVSIDGASVTITVTPTYHWDFGDGATAVSASPGNPYTSSVDPSSDPGYYIDHTYLDAGPRTVTLTVVWQPTYTIVHVVGTFTATAVTLSTSELVPVVEAQAVLTGNS